MRRQRAFTLIEVMVAMAVIAVLGLLSYRGVAAAADTRQRLAASNARWQDIVRLIRRIDSDCQQMAARPTVAGGDVRLLQAQGGDAARLEFSFLRADGASGQLRRYGYRLADGQILLLRWPAARSTDTPRADLLLDSVARLELRFFRAGGQAVPIWPPDAATLGELPVAIDFELELKDAGRIHRLIAIR